MRIELPNIVTLAIVDFVLDPGLQPRTRMNSDIISEYADKLLAGVRFPPVVAYPGQR